MQDAGQRDDLLELLLATSTQSAEKLVSFEEYMARMAPGQDDIYYMTGDSRTAVENSPHLEAFRAKGIEVLILTDPIDEVWLQSVYEYKGKKLRSAARGTAEFDAKTEDKKDAEPPAEEESLTALFNCIKTALDEYVKEVRVSSRLTESLACLVGDEGDMSPQFLQMLRAMDKSVTPPKRILEINTHHPVVEKLRRLFELDKDDPVMARYSQLLYGSAVLAEGGLPPNPGAFSRLVTELMAQ
jgi:molecular chaperone HtpG